MRGAFIPTKLHFFTSNKVFWESSKAKLDRIGGEMSDFCQSARFWRMLRRLTRKSESVCDSPTSFILSTLLGPHPKDVRRKSLSFV
jgi:hypothetical protein